MWQMLGLLDAAGLLLDLPFIWELHRALVVRSLVDRYRLHWVDGVLEGDQDEMRPMRQGPAMPVTFATRCDR